MSKSVVVGISVLAILVAAPGCGPSAVCGNGIIEGEEECDNGGDGEDDGCWPSCVVAPGWECDDESSCDPLCNDGRTVSAEVCDPSDPEWAGYCSADCMMITGSCGDEIVQSSEDCDDGMPGGGDGCNDSCQESLGWTCPAAAACDASSVDPSILIGDLSGADLTAFCTWLIDSLGGTGTVHRCGDLNYTVNAVATCESSIAELTGATAACSVGEWESWMGERSGACDFFQTTTAICP